MLPSAKSSVVLPLNTAFESMLMTPVVELYSIGEVLLKCALTSLALGPVYVNTPVVFAYVRLPSPPVSVTLN